MAVYSYGQTAYSSANPAIDQLFSREFGLRQAAQAADENYRKNLTALKQVEAQRQLAMAQLQANQQAQQQANLFKQQELQQRADQAAANQRLFGRQLDIDEKYKNALSGSTREDILKQNRKQSIIDAQSAAKVGAQSLQDIYESNLAAELEAAKKNKFHFWTGTDTINKTLAAGSTDPIRVAAENNAWQKTLLLKQGDRTGAYQHVIPDHNTRQFIPATFDESGNIIVPQQQAGPSASLTPNPAALGTGSGGLIPNAPPATPAPVAPAEPWVDLPAPGGNGAVKVPHSTALQLRQVLDTIAPEQRPGYYQKFLMDTINSHSGMFSPNGPVIPDEMPNYNRF